MLCMAPTKSFAQDLAASSVDAQTPTVETLECQVCVQKGRSFRRERFNRTGAWSWSNEIRREHRWLFCRMLNWVRWRKIEAQWSVTDDQVDLLTVEWEVWALCNGPPGHILTRERDQGLAAALATEVIQNNNRVWLKLQKDKKQTHTRSHFNLL